MYVDSHDWASGLLGFQMDLFFQPINCYGVYLAYEKRTICILCQHNWFPAGPPLATGEFRYGL